MATRGYFGINQIIIHADFKTPSVRGDEPEFLDFALECVQQPICQTDSFGGVVSSGTVNDVDLQHETLLMGLPYELFLSIS